MRLTMGSSGETYGKQKMREFNGGGEEAAKK